MPFLNREKIYLGLASAALVTTSLLWSRLPLPEFPGAWMCKTFLLVLGSINLIGALFLNSAVGKALLAINSLAISLLIVELWLSGLKIENPNRFRMSYKPKTVNQIAQVKGKLDILAIGDSQTKGVNVGTKLAWPARLQGLTGRRVMNWSEGGFAFAEYWKLFEEGLNRNADTIVVGFYFGNDVWGTFNTVYKDKAYSQFQTEAGLQLRDTVEQETKALWSAIHGGNQELPGSSAGFWSEFWNRSEIVRWIRAEPDTNSYYSSQKAWVHANPQHGSFYENARVRTVFMTSYRLAGQDLDNPVNREGLRIVQILLKKMRASASKSGTRFLLLMIPSKEIVYADLASSKKDPVFAKLVANEARLREIITATCSREGIHTVDALPVLTSVATTIQIYREVADGHPVGPGYFQIARAVYRELEQLNWLERQASQ